MANDTPAASWPWTPRQVALATVFVVGVLAGFFLLYRFRTVILLFFVAMMIGAGVKPAVKRFARLGVPRLYAEILIYLVLLAAIVTFGLLAVPPLLEQGTALTGISVRYYNEFRGFLANSDSDILRSLAFRLPPRFEIADVITDPTQPTDESSEENRQSGSGESTTEESTQTLAADQAVARAFNIMNLAGQVLFGISALFLLSFYWTLEDERAIRSVLFLFPSRRRNDLRELIEEIEEKLGGFLLGQGLLALTIGALSLIAFTLIGLPNALLLAMIAGITEVIPIVGPILGAIPAVIVASAIDPTKVIWVLVAAAVIQFLENNLLVPRVMKKSVGVNPLLTLLAFATLASLLGILGALLAVPLAAVFQVLINRFLLEPMREAKLEPEGRDYLSYLRLQAQELAQDIRRQEQNGEAEDEIEELEPGEERLEESIEAVANELDRLLSDVAQREAT